MSFAFGFEGIADDLPVEGQTTEEILAARGWIVSDPIHTVEQVKAFQEAARVERAAAKAKRDAAVVERLHKAGFSVSEPITTDNLDAYLDRVNSAFRDESDLGLSH